MLTFLFFSLERFVTFELQFRQERLNKVSNLKYLPTVRSWLGPPTLSISLRDGLTPLVDCLNMLIDARACTVTHCFICTSAVWGRFWNLAVCSSRAYPLISYAPFSLWEAYLATVPGYSTIGWQFGTLFRSPNFTIYAPLSVPNSQNISNIIWKPIHKHQCVIFR